jgi:hypothetical protein
MRDNVNVRAVNVSILGDEVVASNGSKDLGRADGVLLGEDVESVLNRVGGDDDAVISFGIAARLKMKLVSKTLLMRRLQLERCCSRDVNLALQHGTYRHLHDRLHTSLGITENLAKTDPVLAIASRS